MRKISLSIIGFFLLTLVFALPAHTQSLSDINSHTYQSAIQELVDLGIINGYTDGTYKPNNTINRAEFLKIVIGAFKSDVGDSRDCFPDVTTEWFAKYVCYGKNHGIIEGYEDGRFKPAQTVNYVEALKMLYQTNDDNGNAEGNQWYSPYLDDAVAQAIALSGLEPDHLMTRGEIAELVWRYANNKEVALEEIEAQNETDPSADNESTKNTETVSEGGNTGVDLSACNNAQITGNAIYVSPNGDDSNDGSIDHPKQSVLAALEDIEANTTVVLREGTYVESSELRIRVPNITIRSMPGEWAVIDRSSDTSDSGIWFYVGSDGGKLQCTEVKGGFYAVSTETMWDWGGDDRSGASNILIENNKLHSSARDVVKIKPNSDHITLRHNEIYNSGVTETPGDCNAEGIDNVNGDNMLVQNNYIHDICSTGVYFKGGATDGIVENNRIENTGNAGVIIGFDTSPEYFDLDVNPDYYENIGGIVRNNLIKNAGWAGIALYASKDAQIYHNTIINTAATYHSPIYFGITFQDWDPDAGRPANANPSIHDNVISQASHLEAPMISIRVTDELGGLSGLQGNMTLSGNCYFQEGTSVYFEDSRTQIDQGGWTADWTGNLTEWKVHIGSDDDAIENDPYFNDDFEATGVCAGKGYQK